MMRQNAEAERMRAALDPGPVPELVNDRLRAAYDALPERRREPARPRLRVWRTALAAAALCAAMSVTVLAATGELVPMVKGAIAFFSAGQTSTLDSIQSSFESYNAAVELQATDGGITFTVDNISVDDNFINLFGRMQMPGLRAQLEEQAGQRDSKFDGQIPDRWLLVGDLPWPVVKVDGTVYGADNALSDSINLYFLDDDTVAYARRILVDGALADSFTMQILPSYATRPTADGAGAEEYQTLMGVEGDWTLSCGVDISAVKGAVKRVQAQELVMGSSRLDLKKFSVSPLGAIAVVDEHYTGEPMGDITQQEGYLSMTQCAVRDDQGNWLYWMQPAAWSVGQQAKYEFTKPADDAAALTFVPIQYGADTSLQKAYAPLEQGAKLEITNLSGYTIESFALEGRHFEVTLTPYGPQAYGDFGLELSLCTADGSPAYDENQMYSRVVDDYTDHATGSRTVTIDFYHDEPLLASAVQLEYTRMGDIALDEANAVTVPLQ